MTRDARGRKFVAIKVPLVARIAFDFLVAAFERKLRRLRMVEVDFGPLLRSVTRITLGPVTIIMGVLRFVTIDTSMGNILVALSGMADGALHLFVRSLQRELCLRVIKCFLLFP